MRIYWLLSILIVMKIASFARAENTQKNLSKLQKYSLADFDSSKKTPQKEINKKLETAYHDLENVVQNAMNDKKEISSELIKQIIRVSVLTYQRDPSEAATEIVLPLYKKERKRFEKTIETLPEKDRKEFQKSMKNVLREEIEGNG